MAKAAKGAAQMKFGRYNALTKLGQGAMATVYLAEDPALNRMVAIKVIHSHLSSNSNLLDRFTVEAKTAAGLRNPNIVEIFDYGLENGSQYLVMEYIDGPNLQFILNLLGGQPMEPEMVAAIILQAAEGLQTADKFGVVHRDIKPENMMFTSDGKLKIADFGIAHISEQNLTQTGSILGSPNFMSPEQIEGNKPTHQTDMFSLGSVFYYCLAGTKPFTGANINAIMRNICDLPHTPVSALLPDVDPFLNNLVETLLQKEPANRGSGARWLTLQLRTYLNKKGILDPADATKDFLEKIGKMGNQTVIDLTPPPDPDLKSGKGKTPLQPGMKAERAKTGTGSGSGSGSGIRSGSGAKPGTWQAGSRMGEGSDFGGKAGGRSGNSGENNSNGNQGSMGKGKSIGLWIGGGIIGLGILAFALFLILNQNSGKSNLSQKSNASANSTSNPSADKTVTVTSITLEPSSIELEVGQKRRVMVQIDPRTAPDGVRWKSLNAGVATVQDGEVAAQGQGQTTVQAISIQDSSKIGSVEVIVAAQGQNQNASNDFGNSKMPVAKIENQGEGKALANAGIRANNNASVKANGNASANEKANEKANESASEKFAEKSTGKTNEGSESSSTKSATENKSSASDEKSAGNKGYLSVVSAPPFAEVIVDGRFIGTTPVKSKELSLGRHKVQITHRSFPPIDTSVVISAGEKSLHFRLFH